MSPPISIPRRRLYYNFRYFLPWAPRWGDADYCNRRLDELLAFCWEVPIEAVQLFVNTLPGIYYMPARSAEDQLQWAAWMKHTVAPALRAMGVSYQLNIQALVGAGTSGVDMRPFYGWECMVDSEGRETPGVARPLGPIFRERMAVMLRLWADTRPDVMWIDDDFRLHNHGLATPRGEFYCYCPLHLAGFAQQVGREWSREALLQEVLKPGPPSEFRLSWLDYLGQTMTQSAVWIREQVHTASPSTRLALMTSHVQVHAVEGRDWKSLLDALCGPHKPMTRPASGLYAGTTRPVKANAVTISTYGRSMAALTRIYGCDGVEFGPELENTRFTTWSKSVRNSRYVMTLGQLMGVNQITLSTNDLEGSPLDDEPTTLPMLRDVRPRLEALAAMELREWRDRGLFWNHARMRWLRAALLWLSDNQFPVLPIATQHGLTIARQRENTLLLAHANLTTDPLTRFTFRAATPLANCETLDDRGVWRSAAWSSVGDNVLEVETTPVQSLEWLVTKWATGWICPPSK